LPITVNVIVHQPVPLIHPVKPRLIRERTTALKRFGSELEEMTPETGTTAVSSTVYVVDGDTALRDDLSRWVRTEGLAVEAFARAGDFLAAIRPELGGCLVAEAYLEDLDGPGLQAELDRRGVKLPIVFLTARGDVSLTVKVMQAGALDVLVKPAEHRLLLDRIRAALARDAHARKCRRISAALRDRLTVLTRRERQVLELLVAGHTHKQIARCLGISHRTVEIHRTHIMLKTGASNVIELVRLVDACTDQPIPPFYFAPAFSDSGPAGFFQTGNTPEI
jgi:FixJ family two-component response regulator